MSRAITGDVSWVYAVEEPAASNTMVRQIKSATKSMIIIIFDIRGIVHLEFVPQGQNVNLDFYLEILRHLREHIRRKQP